MNTVMSAISPTGSKSSSGEASFTSEAPILLTGAGVLGVKEEVERLAGALSGSGSGPVLGFGVMEAGVDGAVGNVDDDVASGTSVCAIELVCAPPVLTTTPGGAADVVVPVDVDAVFDPDPKDVHVSAGVDGSDCVKSVGSDCVKSVGALEGPVDDVVFGGAVFGDGVELSDDELDEEESDGVADAMPAHPTTIANPAPRAATNPPTRRSMSVRIFAAP